MTQADAPPTKRRWSPRLQFSLRVLLVAFTAFAIGFPIWYRWPYDEVEFHYPEVWGGPGGLVSMGTDTTKPPVGRVVKTWQRQWGSLKGVMVRREGEDFSQRIKEVEHFRDDRRHGRYTLSRNGVIVRSGQYERGMREGVWVDCRNDVKYTAHWHRDKLDGVYEVEAGGVKRTQALFAAGRIVRLDGQPVDNLLFDRLVARKIDDRTNRELRSPVPIGIKFVETPLRDAIQYLQDQHQVPFQLDRHRLPDVSLPITADHCGVDLCSALTLILEPYDLACDYRYGVLWVTTAEDARNWRDPTGVSQIHPPRGSALAEQWNTISPLGAEVFDEPLEIALDGLAKQHGIVGDLDISQIPASGAYPNGILVTANLKGLPLRHMLGILLYHGNCRCQLKDGKLVILPPEDPVSK